MPSVRAASPAGESLRRRMRSELKSLDRDLDAARSGARIHPARKRLKAARSLLRMVKPALAHADFHAADHALRDAAHALAGLRRAEAMSEAVGKLAATKGETAGLLALTRAPGPPPLSAASETGAGTAIDRAAASLLPLRAQIASWRLPKRDVTLFVQGMRESYARARKCLAKGLAARDAAILHEARKSVIHHYHHIDFLKGLWPQLFKVWRDELRGLREALGDLHDLAELQTLLAAQGAIADHAAAQSTSAARHAELLAAIASAAHRLFSEKPGAFAARIAALWSSP